MVRALIIVWVAVHALAPWSARAALAPGAWPQLHIARDPDFEKSYPDGSIEGKVVFASNRDGDYDIFVMNGDGSARTKLTFNDVDDYYPDWSPDGQRIAFVRDFVCHDLCDPELMIMRADGSHQRRIKLSEWPEREPAWSPNGRWIAFASGGLRRMAVTLWLFGPTARIAE